VPTLSRSHSIAAAGDKSAMMSLARGGGAIHIDSLPQPMPQQQPHPFPTPRRFVKCFKK